MHEKYNKKCNLTVRFSKFTFNIEKYEKLLGLGGRVRYDHMMLKCLAIQLL